MAENKGINVNYAVKSGKAGFLTSSSIDSGKDCLTYAEEAKIIAESTFLIRLSEKKVLTHEISEIEDNLKYLSNEYRDFLLKYNMINTDTPIEAIIPNSRSTDFGEARIYQGVEVIDPKAVLRPNPTDSLYLQTVSDELSLLGDVGKKIKYYKNELVRLESIKQQKLERLKKLGERLPEDTKENTTATVDEIEALINVYDNMLSIYTNLKNLSESILYDDSIAIDENIKRNLQVYDKNSYLYTNELKSIKYLIGMLLDGPIGIEINEYYVLDRLKTALDGFPDHINDIDNDMAKKYKDIINSYINALVESRKVVLNKIKSIYGLTGSSDERINRLLNRLEQMVIELKKNGNNVILNADDNAQVSKQIADQEDIKKVEKINKTKEYLKEMLNPNLTFNESVAVFNNMIKDGLRPIAEKIVSAKKNIVKPENSSLKKNKDAFREKVRTKFGGNIPFEDEIDDCGYPIVVDVDGSPVFAKKDEVIKIGNREDGSPIYEYKQKKVLDQIEKALISPNFNAY